MADKIGHDSLRIDPWTAPSLLIWTESFHGARISSATGFVVERAGHQFLVTAEHVLTGKHAETNEMLASLTPAGLGAYHHSGLMLGGVGGWHASEENLIDENGDPRWSVHPRQSIKDMENWWEMDVDVAVLPLRGVGEHTQIYPIDVGVAVPDIPPGLPVSIVGFPFGMAAEAFFAIWKTGHVASDMTVHSENRYFLVDITTREGMSGSPVYAREWTKAADEWEVKTTFLGLYSGRLREDAEVGIVWRAEVVNEIVDAAVAKLSR